MCAKFLGHPVELGDKRHGIDFTVWPPCLERPAGRHDVISVTGDLLPATWLFKKSVNLLLNCYQLFTAINIGE